MPKVKLDIKDFCGKGHFDIQTPDGNEGDYLDTILEYYAKVNNIPWDSCLDSGEMEAELVFGDKDNKNHKIRFFSYNVEFETEFWEQKIFLCSGEFVIHATNPFNWKDEDIIEDEYEYEVYFKINSFTDLNSSTPIKMINYKEI